MPEQPSNSPIQPNPENSEPTNLSSNTTGQIAPDQESSSLNATPMPDKNDRRKQNIKKGIKYFLVFAILGLGVWQHQNIIDWWDLRTYTPTVDAAQLASNSSMTPLGRKIFYLQRPQVQEKNTFYVSCEEGETAAVLGCFKPGSGIYLLQVTDKRLNGVEEVTAAHEMLHAAYSRLSITEQNRVNKLVEKEYLNIKDQTIIDKIKLYKEANADVNNELHSILGTEVKDLSPELESYYQKYFTNRKKVVDFALSYKSEFTNRRSKLEALDKQLKDIEQQVIANNKILDQQQAQINAEIARLNALKSSGKISQYNAAVPAYNQSLKPFNQLISETNKLVAQYKSLLAKRNKLAEEAQELNKALDSRIRTNAKQAN